MFTAFHGSPLENWLSILSNGLESRSGTPQERNGAAYRSSVPLLKRNELSFVWSRIIIYSFVSAGPLSLPFFFARKGALPSLSLSLSSSRPSLFSLSRVRARRFGDGVYLAADLGLCQRPTSAFRSS